MSIDLHRRELVVTTAAGIASLGLVGCTGKSAVRYSDMSLNSRRPLLPASDTKELVRYATLAANGHNTQPWLFELAQNKIEIVPDLSRRTPVVDPDDHHLYASLGCAVENLAIAAKARGMLGDVVFETMNDGKLVVDLAPTKISESLLFKAIPQRQVSRAVYEGRDVSEAVLARLQKSGNSYGVQVYIITEQLKMEDILELVIDGNSHQMDDADFVKELKFWLRYNPNAAMQTRDGLYAASSGNPTMPDWLGPTMFDLFFKKDNENDKYAEQIRSSSGLVVFVAASDDPEGWVNAGRAYERFALQATVDGLKHAFVNQTVEVTEMRKRLQSLLNIGVQRPNLVVRFGYGPAMPKSLRRPVEEVIV